MIQVLHFLVKCPFISGSGWRILKKTTTTKQAQLCFRKGSFFVADFICKQDTSSLFD